MGNRLSRIYTRTGDDGTTGLGDGSRVRKDHARVEAYGTVDEANSAIGMILAVPGLPPEVSRCLTEIQHDLFDLGGELCIPGTQAIKAERIVQLEQVLDQFKTRCPRSRISSCPAADPPPRPATWRAPSCGAPSGACGHWPRRNRSTPKCRSISTGSRTCCSWWRACWRAMSMARKCSGATTAAVAEQCGKGSDPMC